MVGCQAVAHVVETHEENKLEKKKKIMPLLTCTVLPRYSPLRSFAITDW